MTISALTRSKLRPSARTEREDRPHVRDREATLAAILSAAETELAQHGLHAARTEDIASRAGVTKGLIFHYFESKEKLFEAVLQNAYEPVPELLNKLPSSGSNARERLALIVRYLLQLQTARPLVPSIFMLEGIQNKGAYYRSLGLPSLYAALEKILRQGVKEGVFRKMDTWHAAINIVGLCSFYFCARNNFLHVAPKRDRDPFSSASLNRHVQEVLAFVEGGTTPTP